MHREDVPGREEWDQGVEAESTATSREERGILSGRGFSWACEGAAREGLYSASVQKAEEGGSSCRRSPQQGCSEGSTSWAVGTPGSCTLQRGRLPPSPLDGMLYSGTMNNFLGSEPILIRTLGPQPVLKTDNFLRWLQRKDPSPQPRSGPALSAETGPRAALPALRGPLCQEACSGRGCSSRPRGRRPQRHLPPAAGRPVGRPPAAPPAPGSQS